MERYEVILDKDEDKTHGTMDGFPREVWYNSEGYIDRPNGPAITVLNILDTNLISRQEWRRDGQLHREDGPAIIRYDLKGKPERQDWYFDGARHRENGPAILDIELSNGLVVDEAWYLNGKLHRDGKPARVFRDPDSGIALIETWAINGKYHRIGGPADILRHELDGTFEEVCYFENGVEVGKPDQAPEPL